MKLLTSKLVLAAVGLVVVVVLIILLVSGGDDGDDRQATTPARKTVSAQDLKVGDCVTDALSLTGDVTTFVAVPCDRRHDGEVYTLIELEGETFPGDKFVTGKGQRGCRARLRRQATAKAFKDRTLGFKFVYPTRQSWAQGDREVTCLATFKLPRTGKLDQKSSAT